jgi:putative spermidine/putrescine transport system ATP-binding protein
VLRAQHGLIHRYWHDTTVQMSDFKNEGVVASSAWPYQANGLKADGQPIATVFPKEGVTGWADTTMLHSDARHPVCAYKWMNWSLTPKVQGDVAAWFGSLPVVPQGCKASTLLGDKGAKPMATTSSLKLHSGKRRWPKGEICALQPLDAGLYRDYGRPVIGRRQNMTYAVEFHNVSRFYGDVRAVDGVNMGIRDGEFFSMLGPSGSGKTTCLRLIAGFEQLSGGAIAIYGHKASELPPWQRDVNTVFQDYALFPHMSILDNVAYGLMVKGIGKRSAIFARRRRWKRWHSGLCTPANRRSSPADSGSGWRLPALVNEPRVLLLDEPLGALDLKLREQMQVELKKLQQTLGITFIFVTHDQGEALSMSDRVAVFNNGRIEQIDAPHDLYLRPKTAFVAGFVGTANVFDSELAARLCGMRGVWSLRPEHIRLDSGGEVQVQGVVQAVQYQGAATRIELKLANGDKLLVSQANSDGGMVSSAPQTGQTVLASWSRSAMVPLEQGG